MLKGKQPKIMNKATDLTSSIFKYQYHYYPAKT